MENLSPLLTEYQGLLTLIRNIKTMALNGLWDDVVEQEIVYIQSIERISQITVPANIPSTVQLQFRQLLQDILDTEAQVKELLQNRMQELAVLIQQSQNQKSVNNTYAEFSNDILPGKPQS
ncbi:MULTISPECIES: flagellar protein FliT [Dickeya]|uniref:Flagellar protein FliT n=1 Tax=Dickeya zeae TaxID=204042 RepID=A0AAE6YZI3_9GAMM|nr:MULTISPECIES: flagellar protein FliT [Dickeya]PXW47931.1 flagellar protein FliT [Erwinia sp. AG740]MBP2848802.1 flagella biosynthesis regulatory protein FliT [Dickeya oryzae]MCA6985258.1 flagella biosynthesis regulatory protein FliT [Dickeya zeae]MCO7256115.1 flagella biosynthesis regulatory protein FliT [Dickeya oryzae]MCO7261272.1 flagella biosynthesis regulatory protein FliT [Dickeya zeae]